MTPRRQVAFMLVFLLMAGAAVGYAAIPQNTIQHNHGITYPTINGTLGYWVGVNQIVSAARAASFVTLDTGQGANELYDMDQNVLTTSDVDFASVNFTGPTPLMLNGTIIEPDALLYPVSAASYIIWTPDNINVYMENGLTGAVSSGTDFSTLVKPLITGAGNNGNSFFIKNGEYEVRSDLLVQSDNIHVSGESWETVLIAKDQPADTTLTAGVNLGDTVLPVASTAGFSVGEKIQIDAGAGVEMRYIQSIGVDTITVTMPLTGGHVLGTAVISVMCQFYVTGDGFTLKDIKLDGNSANWPNISPECGATYDIDYYMGNFLTLENVEIMNSRHRPFRGSGDDITLKNCYFHDMSVSGGVHFEGTSHIWERVFIQNCVFVMPSGIGAATPTLALNGGSDFALRDTYIFGPALFTKVNDGLIENCVFEPNDYAEENHVNGCADLHFESNKFRGAHLYLRNIVGPPEVRTLRTQVTNNLFDGDGAKLTIVLNSHDVKVEENKFVNITANTALEIGGSSGATLHNIDVTNNDFINVTSTYTIKIYYTEGFVFSENKQYGCRYNEFSYINGLRIINNQAYNMVSHVFGVGTSCQNVLIEGNYIANGGARGISLTGGGAFPTTPIIIRENVLGATTPLYTDGSYLNIQLPRLILPFVDGTTFLSGDGAAWGWEIDADAEYAVALGDLPPTLQKIYQIKVKAVSLVLEADAMRLEINGYGGASNEAFSTETIAVADKPSTTTNFAANDYVYWTLTSTDDADIGHLAGLDSVMFKVKHEAAGGDDCATDAVFLCLIIEYY